MKVRLPLATHPLRDGNSVDIDVTSGEEDLTKHAGCVAASFVNAMVLDDLAPETPYILAGFVHNHQRGLLQRELYRYATKCIAGHITDSTSAFCNASISVAITSTCARRAG